MSVLLALSGAAIYGFSDFAGGLAARRAPAFAIVFAGQVAGLLLATALFLVSGIPPQPAAMLWGAGAGVFGAIALTTFYRGLALGRMSVVAPLTALVAAIVPLVAGIVFGERPSPLALTGAVIALVAVVFVGAEGGRLPTLAELRGAGVVGALIAGAGFGMVFVLLSRADHDSGVQPLVGARIASLTALALVALIGRRSLVPRGAPVLLVLASGLGDMTANFLFLLAARSDLLSVVGVLLALYPASTVLLAVLVLKERLHRLQAAGLGFAVAGVVLIAVG